MAPMPGRKWPMIWIGVATYFMVWAFIDGFIHRTDDADTALGMLPFMIAAFCYACWYYGQRIKQRQQWRRDKLLWWVLNGELEAPEAVDWDAFERNSAYRTKDEQRELEAQIPQSYTYDPATRKRWN